MPMPIAFAGFLAKPFIAPVVKFFRSITLKQWLHFGLLLLVLFSGYKGYNWVYDRGAHSRDQEVAQLQSQIKQLQTDLAGEKAKLVKWNEDTKRANQQFAAEQETLRKGLQTQLDAANARANQRKVVIHEIPKYITAADDAACVIPVNFTLLHNYAIEGYPPGALDQLSDAATGVQTAPSTLTLSQYAVVDQNNGSEAVRRGAIIHQWEQWYDASKDQFTRAQQSAAEAIQGMGETRTISPNAR